MKLEIKKIGNSAGLILPEELLTRLNLKQGQWLHVTEMRNGGVHLTPCNPDFDDVILIVDEIMNEYDATLRALAQ